MVNCVSAMRIEQDVFGLDLRSRSGRSKKSFANHYDDDKVGNARIFLRNFTVNTLRSASD